ncbi:MAG: hypothetical protein LUD51_05650 [Clostridia bacterium]|nr:hypothetical protein [Clostridia bacterium]
MNYLSLDIGTSSGKCQLFSSTGEILFYKTVAYSLLQQDGEVYVDIERIWESVKDLISSAATACGGEVSSVCISSFGESFVLLDSRDRLLFPPMVYTDPRGMKELDEICAVAGGDRMFLTTGSYPQACFSVCKLLWIKHNHPEILEAADKLMLNADYIGYLLTGERVIDYGLAARTGVFNLDTLTFDADILSALGMPVPLFSRCARAGSTVGEILPSVAEELGLKPGCRLVLGSHDQMCAAIGSGAMKAGDAVDGMGSVECITVLYDHRADNAEMGRQGYICVPYVKEGLYYTFLVNNGCGSLVNWYKSGIMHGYKGDKESFYAYMDSQMDKEPSGILTLPYFGGAVTPYNSIAAKGAIAGLTLNTTDADLYKSILEGTAMEMRLNCETVRAYGIDITDVTAAGGGTNSAYWLQLKADIQNIPVRTLRSTEGGLCGCAVLQAASISGLSLEEAVSVFVQYKDEYLPDKARHDAYEKQYAKYTRLYSALKEFN